MQETIMQETITRPKARNPYIAGKALKHSQGFFGREDILELATTEMSSPDRNAVVLFGQRRIGKTSILLQLQRRLPKDQFQVIYFDLMDRAPVPLGTVLYDLACAMTDAASSPSPSPADFDDEGVFFRNEFLPKLLARLPEGRRSVVLFDEFDVLDLTDDRQLVLTAAARSFFPYVRRLMEDEPRLGFVFVVGRKADELSIDVKAAFKAARYKRVSVLEGKAARDLIKAADTQGTLEYSPAAVDRILQLTSGHPYFTQLVCQLLWDEAYSRDTGVVPVIVPEDVDAVAGKAPEAGENIFEWIWDGLPPAEKVAAAAVAQAPDGRAVSSEEFLEILQRHGIRFMTRELETAPETLVKWEMLREQDGKYSFVIELMRRWVELRKPLARIKNELDRVVPLADNLYQSGDGFYRRGNLENSQNLLQQALTVNPNHLKARLLLSQVCMEQGRLDQAVRELEEAYRVDEVSARYPLIRTLLMREEELTRAGQEDPALALCERVLELSPRERIATEHRTAIWKRRGDQALAGDQLDAASAAYEKISAADMLEKVAQRRKKLQIDLLAKQAEASLAREQWEQAADLYQQLIGLDPGGKTWKASIEGARTEHRFAKIYAEALQALQAGDLRKAQGLLMDILKARAEYKDATNLLVRALRPTPAPVAAKKPMLASLLPLYLKAAGALALCIVAGLVRVPTGNGGLGTTIGFYLGTGVVLAVALIVIEFVYGMISNGRGQVDVERAY